MQKQMVLVDESGMKNQLIPPEILRHRHHAKDIFREFRYQHRKTVLSSN